MLQRHLLVLLGVSSVRLCGGGGAIFAEHRGRGGGGHRRQVKARGPVP